MWGNKWGNIGETFSHLNHSKPHNPLYAIPPKIPSNLP